MDGICSIPIKADPELWGPIGVKVGQTSAFIDGDGDVCVQGSVSAGGNVDRLVGLRLVVKAAVVGLSGEILSIGKDWSSLKLDRVPYGTFECVCHNKVGICGGVSHVVVFPEIVE